MGILGMIGKMAGSKVVETVENELIKKQNRDVYSSPCLQFPIQKRRIILYEIGWLLEIKCLFEYHRVNRIYHK